MPERSIAVGSGAAFYIHLSKFHTFKALSSRSELREELEGQAGFFCSAQMQID